MPCLEHDGAKVWDTLSIAEYVAELKPDAGLLPAERIARAHCRSICGEIHSGFANLRAALPMNLKAQHTGFRIFAGARPDIARVIKIWAECLSGYGGPFLFGKRPSMADAMYAPVCTRFLTYGVELDPASAGYCATIMAWPPMAEWVAAAKAEPDDLEELDAEF